MRSVFFAAALLVAGSAAAETRRAPGFSLPDGRMRQHDIQDFRGKVVIVDLMKTECPTCRKLSQTLERLKAKFGDRVAVLSIVNPPDTTVSVENYIKSLKLSQPILFDCGQVSASYVRATPQNPSVHVPRVFIIDREGMIRHEFGYDVLNRNLFEGDGMVPMIEELLRK